MKYLLETFAGPGALFNWILIGIVGFGMIRSILIITGTFKRTSLTPVIFSSLTGLLGFATGLVIIIDALPQVAHLHRGQALWSGISVDLGSLLYTVLAGILLYALYLTDNKTISRRAARGGA